MSKSISASFEIFIVVWSPEAIGNVIKILLVKSTLTAIST
jgi:hypothetical protein